MTKERGTGCSGEGDKSLESDTVSEKEGMILRCSRRRNRTGFERVKPLEFDEKEVKKLSD